MAINQSSSKITRWLKASYDATFLKKSATMFFPFFIEHKKLDVHRRKRHDAHTRQTAGALHMNNTAVHMQNSAAA
jgi:hypothetical protein